MNHTFSLKITAELENLTEIHHFVETTAATLDLELTVSYDLQLAVDEAVTNIILYGYPGGEGNIELEIEQKRDTLVVRLRDEATSFDPTTIPPPDLSSPLEERALGGLGVYLIQQVMDEVIHRVTSSGGNELTLVKRGIGKK